MLPWKQSQKKSSSGTRRMALLEAVTKGLSMEHAKGSSGEAVCGRVKLVSKLWKLIMHDCFRGLSELNLNM